ncbi:MAG: sulfotransferase, partial [Rhodanobacter sp.]
DVLLSCSMQAFRSPAFMVLCSSLPRLAQGYVQAFEQWYRDVETFAPHVLEWRYESVVSQFDDQVARLAQFLGTADASPMTRFAEHARAKRFISTPSYAQVTEGVHRNAVGRWQHYREPFEPVLPVLQPWLDRLGYSS